MDRVKGRFWPDVNYFSYFLTASRLIPLAGSVSRLLASSMAAIDARQLDGK